MEKLTKTSLFLLPIFDTRPSSIGKDFFNSYLSEKLNIMYIIYKNSPEREQNIPEIIKTKYEHAIKEIITAFPYTLFLVSIPEERLNDVEKMLNGEYSKMSINYKHKIIYVYSGYGKIYKKMYEILFPDDNTRKKMSEFFNTELPQNSEVYDKPIREEEIINIGRFINQSSILCHTDELLSNN